VTEAYGGAACPSVRPSVTRTYHMKTDTHLISRFIPSGTTWT